MPDLNDILSRRNGWDPHRHPADHEVALRRIARQRRWAAYQAVAGIERSIRHSADVAAAAELSLLDEAYAARMRAQAFVAAPGRPDRRYRVAVRPEPVLATG
ncbi:MAG: hypothetical protein AUI10_05880 [Actinobacteria bacterium 13_2_20CM_2_72_6]|nr:MAG: hypothetical protein AUI10_05880 [Actinobacteria bacterium 13_2_20CM_2_72_6]